MTISNYLLQTGKLPTLFDGYTGYHLFLTERLVFACKPCNKNGWGYLRQVRYMALENLCAGVPRLLKKEPRL